MVTNIFGYSFVHKFDIRPTLISNSNRKNSFLQLALLIRFQHALDQAGAEERARAGEVAGAGKVAHLTWEVVM